ncbi:MAG: tRNA-uridine aminocarboxypropyltransferase, partial [Candidatus Binatia bacterium]
GVNCYCSMIEPFESAPPFVILIHPREAKHRLGTGRMAHRVLRNSRLLEGVDFSRHDWVNREIENPANAPMLLFPGPDAVNLTKLELAERRALFAGSRIPLVFVPDGTWNTVRKTLRLSDNLRQLPKICFDPPAPSAYGFRREPRPNYLSTIEAIHQVIQLLRGHCDANTRAPGADRMLAAFHFMVEAQLARSPSAPLVATPLAR